jgi:hypothetical protein
MRPSRTTRPLDSFELAGVVEYFAGAAGAFAIFFLAANAAVGAEAAIRIASRRAPLRIVDSPELFHRIPRYRVILHKNLPLQIRRPALLTAVWPL